MKKQLNLIVFLSVVSRLSLLTGELMDRQNMCDAAPACMNSHLENKIHSQFPFKNLTGNKVRK